MENKYISNYLVRTIDNSRHSYYNAGVKAWLSDLIASVIILLCYYKHMDNIDYLKKCGLFQHLEEAQLMRLAERLKPIVFRRNAVIFLKDEVGEELYIIRSGRVKISMLNSDGKDLIINIYGQNEVFGEMALFDGLPRSASATALQTVEVLSLSRAVFKELLGNVPGLAVNIIELLSRRLRYTTEQAQMLGLFDAYERVAHKLVQLAELNQTSYEINLSQQELAAMLGLTREWLNKVLKAFAQQGLLEQSRAKIIIRDLKSLKQM